MATGNHFKFVVSLRKAAVSLSLVILLAASQGAVFAQSSARVQISEPNTSGFPTVSFYMEAFNDKNEFVGDLRAEDVKILENGQEQAVNSLQKITPGIQIIVAINAAPQLAETVAGVSHFDRIREALKTWALTQAAGGSDDFSLVANTGLQAIREKDPQKWVRTLEDYQPDLAKLQSGTVSLTQALDLATDPNTNARMKRAILYITPPPAAAAMETLPNMLARAQQLGINLFVWQVGPLSSSAEGKNDQFAELVLQNGGQFLQVTGKEAIPDLNTYLDPLRFQYQVSYTSVVKTSGSNTLAVSIQRSDLEVESSPQSFKLSLQPPNPIFLYPPDEIVRSWSQGDGGVSVLMPEVYPLKILIEFPDGFNRPLKVSRLIVDGEVALENRATPFDTFNWNLDSYKESGTHSLQVMVEDGLGLSRASIVTQVEVVVDELPIPWWQRLFRERYYLLIFAAVLAAAGVFALVVVGGRMWLRQGQARPKQAYRRNDPVTQPVSIRQELPPRPFAGETAPTIPREGMDLSAPARLVRVSEDGHTIPVSSILLSRPDYTLGSDPLKSICVLNSTSVDSLHARLKRNSDGIFMIWDAGSVAGTWVNYDLVPLEGTTLKHGDLIFFGRLAFRFEMTRAPKLRQPVVTLLREDNS